MKTLTEEELEKIRTKGNVLIDLTLFTDTLLMTDQEIARLIKAIAKYLTLGEIPNFSEQERIAEMAFTRFKVSNDNYNAKYISQCKKKSEAKKREWEERKKNEPKQKE